MPRWRVRVRGDLRYPHVVDDGIIALRDAETTSIHRATNETVGYGRMTPPDTFHTTALFRKTE